MALSPSRVFWKYLNSPAWWVGLVLTVVGIVLLAIWQVASTSSEEEQRRFTVAGVRTTARITMINFNPPVAQKPGQPPEQSYAVVYQYQDAAGHNHGGSFNIRMEERSCYNIGDSLPIEYLKDNPENSRQLDSGTPAAPPFFKWFGLVLLCGGPVLFLFALARAWRRMRIVRHGIPVLGRVLGIQTAVPLYIQILQMQRADKTPSHYLRYSFQDPGGSIREVLGPELPVGMETRWQPGDPVLVLHHPNNIKRQIVDIFGARQEDLEALLAKAQGESVTDG
jgi:4-amino-4-deoxy-L-arabinose transferase-like glycosyltransferase